MAAYAALVSLQNTITLEKMPRPFQPHQIPFDARLLDSLLQRANFLVEFLEEGWRGSSQDLEDLMVGAAYAAEDAFDSYIASQITGESTGNEDGSVSFCQNLENIIGEMDSIKKEVIHFKERNEIRDLRLRSTLSSSAGSFNTAAHHHKKKMVGFEDQKILLMEKLAGHNSSREVIPIVGMGGMGKTALARNVYEDKYIVERFDIRAWVTVSQEYNVKNILNQVLGCCGQEDVTTEMSESALGEQVHKTLYGRRYLIVVDDIWSVDAWDRIRRSLPDDNNQSRVVITTRLLYVANECATSCLTMKFLNEESSWALLSQTVFGQETCPLNDLEEVGKKIATSCGGLPLAIVAIGGLLVKSDLTLEHWSRVAEDVRSTMHLGTDKHCLEILYSSYNHLPVHLKPCLLYMAIFPEDYQVRVPELCRLWAAEGFLKPIGGQTLEESAEVYIKDLVERNLIFLGFDGRTTKRRKVRFCYIHDLVRDLCLREAQSGNFFYVAGRSHNDSQEMSIQRRFAVYQAYHILESISIVRYLTCEYGHLVPLHILRFLRVFNGLHKSSMSLQYKFSHFVNSRYVNFHAEFKGEFPHSICLLRNLQTLVVTTNLSELELPFEVWNLQQLRHMMSNNKIYLPQPSAVDRDCSKDCVVLENLQTLKCITDFRFSEKVVERIPNIRKLRILYHHFYQQYGVSHFGLNHLVHFQKLESLTCYIKGYSMCPDHLLHNLVLPLSLKKLSLHECGVYWQDMTMIGLLPHLEVLRICGWDLQGREWNPIEGEFQCLKYLHINDLWNFETWGANATHFPRLEHLVLQNLPKLKVIPSEIAEIPTLGLIELIWCSESAVISAENIMKEQEDYGNEEQLQVKVYISDHQRELLSLASENFPVRVSSGRHQFHCSVCYS